MKDTKNNIIDSSYKLFLEKSFKEVTLSEILKATGIAKGTFYYYFESKEQLFNKIVDSFLLNYSDQININEIANLTLAEFVNIYINVSDKFIKKMKAIIGSNSLSSINFYRLMFDAIEIYPGFREKLKRYNKEELNLWKTVIDNSKDNKEIRVDINSLELAKQFVFLYDGLGMRCMIENNIENIRKQAKNLLGSLESYVAT